MTTSHQGIKHDVKCNGAQSKICYARWAPTSAAAQTITDAQGVTSIARNSIGNYTLSFSSIPNLIIPLGADVVENDTTVRHTVRVESTSASAGTATISHKVSTFALEAGLTAVSVRLADVSTASTVYVTAPVSGTVYKIYSTLGAAISGANAGITTAIGGVAITSGTLTVAYSGSAAGDLDTATPSAANTVVGGTSVLSVATDGASTDTATLDVVFVIAGTGATPAGSDTADELSCAFLLVGGNL